MYSNKQKHPKQPYKMQKWIVKLWIDILVAQFWSQMVQGMTEMLEQIQQSSVTAIQYILFIFIFIYFFVTDVTHSWASAGPSFIIWKFAIHLWFRMLLYD